MDFVLVDAKNNNYIFDNEQNTYPEKREFQKKDLFIVIMEDVFNGKVKSYDTYYENIYHIKTKEFTIKDIEDKFGAVDEVIMVEDLSKTDGSMIETTIEGAYDIEEVKGIAFLDEWYFDAENFTFTKNTIAYTPVRSYLRANSMDDETDQVFRKKVCTLNFENLSKKQIKKSNKRLVHYATIKYEQKIYNYLKYVTNDKCNSCGEQYENENAPFLTSYGRNVLAETIFNKVLSGETIAYDFDSQEKIKPEDVKGRMGAGNVIIMIEEDNGQMVEKTIEGQYNLSDIQSYVFTEDWYLDPETLRIVKKVRAIAPVRYYIKDNGGKESLHKRIVFELKLN